jgi:hypothetical protein
VSAHEVAIVGQILVHLKDPYNALREAAACCSDTLIIAEGSFDAELPYAYFAGGAAATSYWQISNAMYRDWLEKFGFTLVYQNRSSYTCRHPNSSPEHQVWTFVARRKEFVKEPPRLITNDATNFSATSASGRTMDLHDVVVGSQISQTISEGPERARDARQQ